LVLLNEAPVTVDEIADRTASVVRTKTFEMRPMSVEEAALQMEMLGHDFFFFLDGDSGQHSVLCHRRWRHLGLIEPR
jgi:putative sigma-54 modulation protein